MKTTFKFTIILTLMLTAKLGYANEVTLSLVTGKDTKSIVFGLDASNEEMDIKLLDEQGNIIYSESVEDQNNYIKRFDLTNLAKGRYFFKAENVLKTVTYSLDITKEEVIILDKKEMAKPVYREKESVLYMNLLNHSREKVKIKVTDQADRKIFEETFDDEQVIGKVFNFKSAFPGTYTIMIKNSNATYYKEVRIK